MSPWPFRKNISENRYIVDVFHASTQRKEGKEMGRHEHRGETHHTHGRVCIPIVPSLVPRGGMVGPIG